MREHAGFSSLEVMVAGLILSGSVLLALQWQASAGQVMQQAIEEYLAGVQAQEMLSLLAMSEVLPQAETERLMSHWMANSHQFFTEPVLSLSGAGQCPTLSWLSHAAGQRFSLAVMVPGCN